MSCIQVEPAPPPALDFPDINFVQKRRDDEDDLERLEKGLKVWHASSTVLG